MYDDDAGETEKVLWVSWNHRHEVSSTEAFGREKFIIKSSVLKILNFAASLNFQ